MKKHLMMRKRSKQLHRVAQYSHRNGGEDLVLKNSTI